MDEPFPSPPGEELQARDRFRVRVAVLIALVSIAGAIVAWRASVSSIEASALDHEAQQELTREQQERAALQGIVANDLQLFGRYQQHVKAWKILERQAEKIRAKNPDLADSLGAQAQGELALARSLRQFFQGGTPDYGDEDGTVVYDPEFVLRNLVEQDPELTALEPDEAFAEAREAHSRTVDLVGIVALLIGSVFLLTVAQFARPSTRRTFAGAGAVLMVAGIVLFIVVEAAA